MIGRKKLSTIRQELEQALKRTAQDPIQWLEEQIRARTREGEQAPRGTEVLESLRRFLEVGRGARRRSRRGSAKKS
jgi:hypothetical protein